MADTIGSFLGNTVGEAAAFAAGIAVGPVLAPLLKALENEAWSEYPDAPLEALLMAQAVLEGKIDPTTGAAEAKLTGISPARFASLQTALGNAPSIAAAMTLIRRGQLEPTEFATVLKRAGLEAAWVTAYEAASSTDLLPWETPASPPDLALGLIRGNLNGFTVDGQPAFPAGLSYEGSNVPIDPVLGLDVVAEAAASGLSPERMALLARNVGLPPGVVQGLQMLNRGIINEAAFALLIAQSDARLSWGPFLLQLKDAIFTAHEAADLRLRGYIDTPTMYKLGALEGYTEAQMDLMLDDIGRPLAVHQVTTGLSRGGVWTGEDQTAPQPYLAALEQSNIKPPWYSLAYANRFTYPGYFVLKPLVASGAITVDQATTYLLYQGWEPELAALTAESFASTAATKPKTATAAALLSEYEAGQMSQADTQTALAALGYTPQAIDIEIAHADYALAKRYQSAASKALESEYLAYRIDTPTATSQLEAAGYTPTAVQYALAEWNILRGANLKTLTAAQIRVAVHKGVLDQADATTELENLGYTAADANTYLNS